MPRTRNPASPRAKSRVLRAWNPLAPALGPMRRRSVGSRPAAGERVLNRPGRGRWLPVAAHQAAGANAT